MSDEKPESTALVPQSSRLPEVATKRGITEAQWLTLRNSLFPGAKDVSVLLVWDYCTARGLDPMKKPCHIVPMEVKIGNTYEWRDVILPGIYEFRTTAHRTGEYLGHSEPVYGEAKEFAGVTAPEWCAMTVYRWNHKAHEKVAFPVKIFFAEVCAVKRDGKANARWSRAPIQMLTKCFDQETEVLTTAGFRLFSEVGENDQILQVTEHGLSPVVAQPFSVAYGGEMVCLDSDDLNFCVTPNHDMMTTHGKIEAGDLYSQSRSRPQFWIPRTVQAHGTEFESLSDKAIRLSAAYLADGWDHGNAFVIAVSRQRKLDALRQLALHHSERPVSSVGQMAQTSTRVIVTRQQKFAFRYAPNLISPLVLPDKQIDMGILRLLSQRQARLFVDTLIEFDGSINKKTGVRRFMSTREDHVAAFELACVVAGYSVNQPTRVSSDISTKPVHILTISDRHSIPVRRVGRKFHATVPTTVSRQLLQLKRNTSGQVWCVTVPSGVIVVRRHGFSMLCGNCAEAAAIREGFPEEIGGEHTVEEMADQRAIDITPPKVAEVTINLLDKLPEGLRDNVEKALSALKQTLGQRQATINEFLGSEGVVPEEGAERLLKWAEEQLKAPAKPKPDNGRKKKPEPEPTLPVEPITAEDIPF